MSSLALPTASRTTRRILATLVVAIASAIGASAPAAASPTVPAERVIELGSGAEAIAGELVVRYRPGHGPGAHARALGRAGATPVENLSVPRVQLVDLPRDEDPSRAAARISADPAVAYAEPNYVRRLRATPDDTLFASQWSLAGSSAHIDAAAAWEFTTGSAAVRVAIVDDGVDLAHPDLAANIGPGRDFVDGDSVAQPAAGETHGTHVAGIAGAVGNNARGIAGVNWRVSLMPLRIFSNDMTDSRRIADAFTHAAANGARIVNASFGGPGSSNLERNAIGAAPQMLFVAATANENRNYDLEPDYPCDYEHANIVCVTSTDQDGSKSSFAGYGPESVDIGAPGRSIRSTVPGGGYLYMSGTSMATPHVSGVAALMLAVNPGLSTAGLRTLLREGVEPAPALESLIAWGGRLNAARSVAAALELAPASATPPADGTGGTPTPTPPSTYVPPAESSDPPAVQPAPRSRIVSKPKRRVITRKASVVLRFRFKGNATATRFQCRLRGAGAKRARFHRCESPVRYRVKARKKARELRFVLRAVSASGEREAEPSRARVRVRRR